MKNVVNNNEVSTTTITEEATNMNATVNNNEGTTTIREEVINMENNNTVNNINENVTIGEDKGTMNNNGAEKKEKVFEEVIPERRKKRNSMLAKARKTKKVAPTINKVIAPTAELDYGIDLDDLFDETNAYFAEKENRQIEIYVKSYSIFQGYQKLLDRKKMVIVPRVEIKVEKGYRTDKNGDQEFYEETKVKFGRELMPLGRLTRNYTVYKSKEEMGGDFDMTLDYAMIAFKDNDSRKYMQDMFNGLNIDLENKKVYGINKMFQSVDIETGDIDRKQKANYKMFGATFSGNRNGSFVATTKYLMDCEGNPTDVLRSVNDEMNDGTLGALARFNREFNHFKEVKSAKAFNKMVATIPGRLAQALTGSNNLGTVKNFAVVDGKLQIASVADGKLKKDDTMDGMTWASSTAFAKEISKTLSKMLGRRIYIAPFVLEGLVAQVRPGMVKASMIVVSPEVMAYMWKNITKEYGYTVYQNDKNATVPDYIFDKNAIKLDWDYTLELALEVLMFAHESAARTSFQGLNKVMAQDSSRASEILMELMDETLDKAERELMCADVEVESTKNSFTCSQLKSGVVDKILMNNKVFGQAFAPIVLGKKLKNFEKSLSNKADKLKFEIAGGHYVLQSDFTQVILGSIVMANGKTMRENGISVLPTSVCYNNSLARQGIKRVALIKHPSQGFREVAMFDVWGIEDVMNRLEELEITDAKLQVMIRNLFVSLKDGVMMVPSSRELMNKLAGLDFDIDSVIAYADERLIKIFDAIEDVTVEISKDDEIEGINEVQAFNKKFAIKTKTKEEKAQEQK